MSTLWLSFLGGLFGGGLGAGATVVTARLRERGAKREEWWRRVQWAAEMALSRDAHRRVAGLNILADLVSSDLATPNDVRMLSVFSDPALATLESRTDPSTSAAMQTLSAVDPPV